MTRIKSDLRQYFRVKCVEMEENEQNCSKMGLNGIKHDLTFMS